MANSMKSKTRMSKDLRKELDMPNRTYEEMEGKIRDHFKNLSPEQFEENLG